MDGDDRLGRELEARNREGVRRGCWNPTLPFRRFHPPTTIIVDSWKQCSWKYIARIFCMEGYVEGSSQLRCATPVSATCHFWQCHPKAPDSFLIGPKWHMSLRPVHGALSSLSMRRLKGLAGDTFVQHCILRVSCLTIYIIRAVLCMCDKSHLH